MKLDNVLLNTKPHEAFITEHYVAICLLFTVMVVPGSDSMMLDLAVTSLLALVWCFVLVHISPIMSDWNSLVVTGMGLLYQHVTIQSVVLAVTIGLPLYFQFQYWVVDSYCCQDQHGKITVSKWKFCDDSMWHVYILHAEVVKVIDYKRKHSLIR